MASEGKIVAGPSPVYGFRYTEDRKGYEVDEAKMRVVRRIFELMAAGKALRRSRGASMTTAFRHPEAASSGARLT